jgi:hypothetical protein
MYQGMDENGKPIPKILRASRLASQSTVPLQIEKSVTKRSVKLNSTPHVPSNRVQPKPTHHASPARVKLIPITYIFPGEVKLKASPTGPPKRRRLKTRIAVLCVVVAFALAIVGNGVLMIVSNQSPISIVLLQQLNQAQSPQQPQTLSASARVSVHRQSNRAEYNNDYPEWQLWSYSACSGCAMAALMDAYGAQKNGKPLNCGDVLEVEYNLGVYDPGASPTRNRGLLPPGQEGLARTAAQFGFTGDYSKNLTLDDLIKLANSGTPSIIGFPTHVMVLKGGDSNNVLLADSGGLHLTMVTREQFLQGLPGTRLYAGQAWLSGWYFTIKPK